MTAHCPDGSDIHEYHQGRHSNYFRLSFKTRVTCSFGKSCFSLPLAIRLVPAIDHGCLAAPVRRPSRSGHRRCGDWAYPDYEAVVSPQGVGERRCRGADSNYWLEEVTHPADVVLVLEVHGPASTFDDRGRCALYRDRELLRDCGRVQSMLAELSLVRIGQVTDGESPRSAGWPVCRNRR